MPGTDLGTEKVSGADPGTGTELRSEVRTHDPRKVPRVVNAVIFNNQIFERSMSVKRIKMPRSFFRETNPILEVTKEGSVKAIEGNTNLARQDRSYRVKKWVYGVIRRFLGWIDLKWLPQWISGKLWSLHNKFSVIEWGLNEETSAYLDTHRAVLERNIRQTMAVFPNPPGLVLYPVGHFYKTWSRKLSLGYGAYSKKIKKKLGGEIMAFRDEQGRVHMPFDFFVSDWADPELFQNLARIVIRAALAENQTKREESAKQEAEDFFLHNPLFDFSDPQLVRQRLEQKLAEEDAIDLSSFFGLSTEWSLVEHDERVSNDQLLKEEREQNLKRVLLEQIGSAFNFAMLLDHETLYQMLAPWMPKRQLTILKNGRPAALDLTQVILRYVKDGSVDHVQDFSLKDWKLALRHIRAASNLGVFQEMFDELERGGVLENAQTQAITEQLAASRLTPDELFKKLFSNYDILFFQTAVSDFEDFYKHLRKIDFPEKTLAAMPIVTLERQGPIAGWKRILKSAKIFWKRIARTLRKYFPWAAAWFLMGIEDPVHFDKWSSLIHYKKATWKDIAQSVNAYLLTGNAGPFLRYYEGAAAGAKPLTQQLKRELRFWRKETKIKGKLPFIYFPDFGINFRTETAKQEQLASAMREYLIQLKEYAEETGASKIVLAFPTDHLGMMQGHLEAFQKPSRNTPDLWHQLLKTEKVLGEKNVATVHVTYDLKWDTMGPLWRSLRQWRHGSFAVPVHPKFAELPVATMPTPGDPYVFGHYDYALITVKRPPNDGSKPKTPEPPAAGEGVKSEIAGAPVDDEMVLVSRQGGQKEKTSIGKEGPDAASRSEMWLAAAPKKSASIQTPEQDLQSVENKRILIDFKDLAQNFSDEQIKEVAFIAGNSNKNVQTLLYNVDVTQPLGKFFRGLRLPGLKVESSGLEIAAKSLENFNGEVVHLSSTRHRVEMTSLRKILRNRGISLDKQFFLAYRDQKGGTLGIGLRDIQRGDLKQGVDAGELKQQLPDYMDSFQNQIFIANPSLAGMASWQTLYNDSVAFAQAA